MVEVTIEGTLTLQRAGVLWGATIRGNVYGTTDWPQNPDSAAYDQFTAMSGKAPSVCWMGGSWLGSSGSVTTFASQRKMADAIKAKGALPAIAWQPQQSGGGELQPDFQTAKISDLDAYELAPGLSFGAYVDQYAQETLDYGRPFLLRFAHEANGDWYPWADNVNGNQEGDYVTMWRAVHERFTRTNPNATWVWCQNEKPVGQGGSFESLYPGDEYTDWVGIDAYNRATGTNWREPAAMLEEPYQAIRALSHHPFAVCELGTINDPQAPHRKADWVSAAYADLSELAGWVSYFQDNAYPDTINPVPLENDTPEGSATGAFRAMISDERYLTNTFADAPAGKIP